MRSIERDLDGESTTKACLLMKPLREKKKREDSEGF